MRAIRRGGVIFALAGLALVGMSESARAQSGISVWGAIGAARDSGRAQFDTDTKQLGVQFGLPAVPIAVRADGLLFGTDLSTDRLSWNVNAVFHMTFPLVQPYGVVGMGDYALSLDQRDKGWNAGGGVRLGMGRLGVFVESRWHDPLKRQITVAGVTF